MAKTFHMGEAVYIDSLSAPVHLCGVADRVRRDEGGEMVELVLLGPVPRVLLRRERRAKWKRPWAASADATGVHEDDQSTPPAG